MRRILRKIVAGEGDQLGDLSSIADPSIVDESECLLFRIERKADDTVKSKVGGAK